MTPQEQSHYNIGKTLENRIKYNIRWNRYQLLNYVCINFINSVLNETDDAGVKYDITPEDKQKVFNLLRQLAQ